MLLRSTRAKGWSKPIGARKTAPFFSCLFCSYSSCSLSCFLRCSGPDLEPGAHMNLPGVPHNLACPLEAVKQLLKAERKPGLLPVPSPLRFKKDTRKPAYSRTRGLQLFFCPCFGPIHIHPCRSESGKAVKTLSWAAHKVRSKEKVTVSIGIQRSWTCLGKNSERLLGSGCVQLKL